MKVTNLTEEKIDDLIGICIPKGKEDDMVFKEGAAIKKRYVRKLLSEYCYHYAKIAYLDDTPVGMIQFAPKREEEILEILCIFVPQSQRQGIGKMLLNSLILDMKMPQPFLNNKVPKGLITYAFESGAGYPQHLFYKRCGFKPASLTNPHLLYYPIEKGWKYIPPRREYIPLSEDRGKAIIFYDVNCPWCYYFTNKTEMAIREVAKDIPIRKISKEEEREEVRKRGNVPFVIINAQPIRTFITDEENFKKEVKEALGQ